MNESGLFISLSKLFCFPCLSVQLGERTPSIHLHDGRFFGDIATCEGSDHGICGLTKLAVDIRLATAQKVSFPHCRCRLIEVRKERSEVLFERGHPVEDADEMRLGRLHIVAGVQHLCNLKQQLVGLCIEITLEQVVNKQVLLKRNLLEVRWQSTVLADSRDTDGHWGEGVQEIKD